MNFSDLQHQLYYLTLGHKLHLAPIPKQIGHCLDVGTGTGLWAIDFGETSHTLWSKAVLTSISRRASGSQGMDASFRRGSQVLIGGIVGHGIGSITYTTYVVAIALLLCQTNRLIFTHRLPPNVEFIIDDAEEPWRFPQKFDFVHVRMMVGSIGSWPNLFRHCYEYFRRSP